MVYLSYFFFFRLIDFKYLEPSVTYQPVQQSSPPGVSGLVNGSLEQPRQSLESLQPNRRQYQLQLTPGVTTFGFSVNSTQPGGRIVHKITQIAPNSPAAQQGK